MALIKCPECQKEVSDKAKDCIHCGYPLITNDSVVKFKTARFPEAIVKIKFTFYNELTNEKLSEAYQGEIVTLNIDKPTVIRVHIGKGYKDAILNYKPHSNAKYEILAVSTFLKSKLVINEVDAFNS